MSAARCPRWACGEVLRFARTPAGRVVAVCDACERTARGVCRDCPAPLVRRQALRCPACARRRTLERVRAANARDYRDAALRRRKLAGQKRRARRPAVRERRRAYMRAWNRANRDAAHRAYMRAYMHRWRAARREAACA